jgi:hypothetical protein
MTAEPIRDPDDDEPRAPASDVPTPDPDASPQADADVNATVEAAGAGAAAPGAAEGAAVDVPSEVPAAVPETPAAVAKPSRRPAIVGALRRLAILVVVVALFVVGIGIGQLTFQRTRPVPLGSVGPITIAETPPAVAQEFITALGANDADGMRSALGAQPNKDLTDEFERFSIKKIVSVQTLGTSVDGNRSATEILLKAEKTDGLPFEVNLVILVDGGEIEGFR